MIETLFFKELDRFSFMVRKRVSTAYSGSRRSILKGRGMEPVSYREYTDRKSTRLNSSHIQKSRMPSSA